MRRKATKQSRGPNAAEKAFQGWLKEQPCCACENHQVQVHHCAGSTYKHNKVLIGHWFCIPLCEGCHGQYHNYKSIFTDRAGSQRELWRNKAMIFTLTESASILPAEITAAIMDSNK